MAKGLETSVSAVLNDTIYSFSSEQQSSGTVMTEEVLEVRFIFQLKYFTVRIYLNLSEYHYVPYLKKIYDDYCLQNRKEELKVQSLFCEKL